MQKLHPLLIGMPFTYRLIDFTLLKKNNIEPILVYSYDTKSIEEGQSVFYNALNTNDMSKIIENNKVDAIVCFNDNFLIETAQLRSKYNIQGIQYPEIQKYKMKSEAYRVLGPHVAVPQTIYCDENLRFEEIIECLGDGEYFVKPNNLAGAEGGCHIKSKNDYEAWKITRFKSSVNYILQKFHSSPLVHCELIVKKGKIQYIQARKYSYPNHMFLSGKIIASFPIVDQNLRVKIEQEAIKVQQLLGYDNGVMHTEFFLEDDMTLVFLETNIRQAGGAINLVHKRRAGVAFETAMVLLELGKEVAIKQTAYDDYDFCGYIPIKQGRVKQIHTPQLKGQYHFDIRVKMNEYYDSPKSASNVGASFVGYSAVYDDLINDFLSLENNDIIQYV